MNHQHHQEAKRWEARGGIRGFTLIEVMVVVTIISLLLGMLIVGVRSLMGKSPEISASNQVSAMLGAARAQAMKLNTDICVYFFTSSDGTEVYMQMGRLYDQKQLGVTFPDGTFAWSGWSYVYRFQRVDDRPAERLPHRVSVASMSLENGFGNWIGPSFMIWFGPDGRSITGKDGFDTWASFIEVDDSDVVVSETREGRATGNLTIYRTDLFERLNIGELRSSWSFQDYLTPLNQQQLQEREQRQQAANEWMKHNAKPIVFNRYSGNVMRRQ